jgi:hypothetical protein
VRERKRKCEEERRKKDTFMVMSMKQPRIFDTLKKEQNYFDNWIRDQERKGDGFKIKSKFKSKK